MNYITDDGRWQLLYYGYIGNTVQAPTVREEII